MMIWTVCGVRYPGVGVLTIGALAFGLTLRAETPGAGRFLRIESGPRIVAGTGIPAHRNLPVFAPVKVSYRDDQGKAGQREPVALGGSNLTFARSGGGTTANTQVCLITEQCAVCDPCQQDT